MKTAGLAAVLFVAVAALLGPAVPASAQPGDSTIVDAREALRQKNRPRLAALKQQAAGHPLAMWVDYWELGNRLNEATVDEVEAFYTRWSGTYVEDRLRNDWLLELGRRRDWANLARDFPRFRMNDDREVTCYALLTQHLGGQDVRAAARNAWLAQRDLDDGCNLLATTLFQARLLDAEDAWQAARLAVEFNRPRVLRAAFALAQPGSDKLAADVLDNPARVVAGKPANLEVAALALARMAWNDPEAAAGQLEHWQRRLTPAQATWAWAMTGKFAALKLQPQATDYFRQAWKRVKHGDPTGWTDDTLAWSVRAALRAPPTERDRWQLVQRSIDAMSAAEQRDAAWVYWKARALQARAPAGPQGDDERAASYELLQSIAGQMSFYGKLATEDLGGRVQLPPAPQPLTAEEREAARTTPGFARALQLIALGLRSEGVREWNYTLRGLGDRGLLAAAALACEREVWDRCINTSDRTRAEVDMAQRFPTPFRDEVTAKAREAGLDPAYVYGLIRQESRFVADARSGVGASGLMQLMPSTAKWTAKKLGVDFKPEAIADRETNLRLGAGYLKLVLDDFGGSQAMAAAAYNAGPNRPRRWREGGFVEAAAWAESIPFNETRDYVKKVLSNAVYYAALLTGQAPSLKARLGGAIGPGGGGDRDLP